MAGHGLLSRSDNSKLFRTCNAGEQGVLQTTVIFLLPSHELSPRKTLNQNVKCITVGKNDLGLNVA
jgi:hypothetical protein